MPRRIRISHHLKLFVAGISLVVSGVCAISVTTRIVSSAPPVPPPPSSTFTVINTNNSGPGSLRQAILDANAAPGADTISFALPGSGVQTIRPQTNLPVITEAVTIDGYTQPGSAPNSNLLFQPANAVIRIELDGSLISGGRGLDFQSNGSVVRGVVVNGFNSIGVNLAGANRLEGCYIGTDATGTIRRANNLGVSATNNTVVGGNTPAARNLISGNADDGIDVLGAGVLIEGNYIGTAADGTTALGNNGNGIQVLYTSNNQIGGMQSGAGNLIASNGVNGISINGTDTSANVTARGNRFSLNRQRGILLYDGDPIQNDEGDADLGPNRQQNYPELSSAASTGGTLNVRYRVSSATTSVVYPIFVDFYLADPTSDEGFMLVGSDTYAAANAQVPKTASFSPAVPVNAGAKLVAIATDSETYNGIVYGNTSMFSPSITVGSLGTIYTVTNTNDSGPNSLRQGIIDANNDSGQSTINFTTTGTINLLTALPALSSNINVIGPGANLLTVRRSPAPGIPSFRIFKINDQVTAHISGLTISNGNLTGLDLLDPYGGAGLYNAGTLTLDSCLISGNDAANELGGGFNSPGTITLNNCTVSGNHAYQGGGMSGTSVFSFISLNNTTVSGNRADFSGGGIYTSSKVTISRSTITNNQVLASGSGGGGIDVTHFADENPPVTNVGGSIIAGNSAPTGPDLQINVLNGSLNSLDYNLLGNTSGVTITGATAHNIITSDPRLLPLENNGGPVPTHALRFDSRALDAGTNTGAVTADGRGFPRIVDGDLNGIATADIGAFEVQSVIVSNTNNAGAGSLRQVLLDNNSTGPGVIIFNIPQTDPNCATEGVCTITPITQLPTITKPVRIAGHTQPGSQRNTLSLGTNAVLKIELSGAGAVGATGLNLTAPYSFIEGLVINRFASDSGITLAGAIAHDCVLRGNRIGTNAEGTAALPNFNGVTIIDGTSNRIGDTGLDSVVFAGRNLISGNSHAGVSILGTASSNNITGNYVGTNGDGDEILANGTNGVEILGAKSNVVGGLSPAEHNLISGNTQNGVMTSGDGADNNIIRGNYIGTNASATSALRNGVGVRLFDGLLNTVDGNVISGNADGVVIGADGAALSNVRGNFIGTGPDGVSPLGNSSPSGGHGIAIINSNNNSIFNNRIANNSAQGIYVLSGSGNTLQSNAIYSNGGLGIDLGQVGPDTNDDGDGDTGANTLQNYPQVTAASYDGTNLTVSGTLNSTPGKFFRLQFFTSPTCDEAGLGEGANPISSLFTTSTDANGNAAFSFTFPVVNVAGQVLTATANSSDLNSNTSEFSLCRPIVSVSSVLQFSTPTYSITEDGTSATISVSRSGSNVGAVSVNYTTADGTQNGATGGVSCGAEGVDYVAVAGTLSWANGDLSAKTFTIPVCNDHVPESTEIINLGLSNVAGNAIIGANGSAVLLVHDNDLPGTLSFSTAAESIDENGTTVNLTVTRSGVDGPAVSVHYGVTGGTATAGTNCSAGVDYIAAVGTLSWAAGDFSSKTFTVSICGDHDVETDETINFGLTDPTNGVTLGVPSNNVLTILNNDSFGTLAFSSAAQSIAESSSTVTFTVMRSGVDGPAISVRYGVAGGTATAGTSCTAGVDYVTTGGTLSWNAGDVSSKTFTVSTCSDHDFETDETVNFGLTAPTGGATLGEVRMTVLTILDNDNPGTVQFSGPSYTVNEAGTSATFSFTRSSVDGPAITVDYATAGGTATGGSSCGTPGVDYVPASGTLAWAAGDVSTRTFSVAVCNDKMAEGNETVGLNLTNPTGGVQLGSYPTTVLTIVDNDHEFSVTNTNDSGTGSLRDSLLAANLNQPPETNLIRFAPGLTGTINLENKLPSIESTLEIEGPGANVLTVRRSPTSVAGGFSIFHVIADRDVTISDLTIANGSGLDGGGILNEGTLTVDRCVINSNTASDSGGGVSNAGTMILRNSTVSNNRCNCFGNILAGGGVANGGTMQIVNSTISGNSSGPGSDYPDFGFGGGIFNAGDLEISRSTITANLATYPGDQFYSAGGGIFNFDATGLKIDNSIIAGNSAPTGPDIGGPFNSRDYNLIGNTAGAAISGITAHNLINVDAQLLPLSDNGGPTPTHALLVGSPALDLGSNTDAPSFDQRGLSRVSDGNGDGLALADIGALEMQAPAVTCATDVSSQLNITRGGFRLNYATGRFVQTVKITNISTTNISGPVALVLDNLSPNASLFGPNGTTVCSAPQGSPFVEINVGTDGVLSPGEAITLTLQFTNPSNGAIAYTYRVLAGTVR